MKKYRGLFRCQLGGYAIWLFGVVFVPVMFIKFSPIPVILLEVLAALILAGEIVAQVFFTVNRKLYVPFSFASHGAATLMILTGFILEIVLTIGGEAGTYALVMLSICLAFYILIDIFLVLINKKVIDGTIDKSKFER